MNTDWGVQETLGRGWLKDNWGWVLLVVIVLIGLVVGLNGMGEEGLAMLPASYPYWRRPYYPYYNSLPFWWRIRYGSYGARKFWSTPLYYRGRPLMWWN